MSEEKHEAAKVIVVTENLDGNVRERRYTAAIWGCQKDGSISVGFEHGEIGGMQAMLGVASYAPGAWLAVREEGALVNDGPDDKRKLAIALEALRSIAEADIDNVAADYLAARAEEALEGIADVDL